VATHSWDPRLCMFVRSVLCKRVQRASVRVHAQRTQQVCIVCVCACHCIKHHVYSNEPSHIQQRFSSLAPAVLEKLQLTAEQVSKLQVCTRACMSLGAHVCAEHCPGLFAAASGVEREGEPCEQERHRKLAREAHATCALCAHTHIHTCTYTWIHAYIHAHVCMRSWIRIRRWRFFS
jgi:hypothetical protein